ncbi:MAG: hypothetical protein NVSMB64_13540 [Candidatus Velthaea sp.]
MTCNHEFTPVGGGTLRFFCRWCAEVREPAPALTPPQRETVPVEAEKIPPPMPPSPLAQQTSMFEPPAAAGPEATDLDAMFGIVRHPDADPPGTYRPNESETPPWLGQ